MIINRLQKNLKKIKKIVNDDQIDSYRIYDRDIPEFPFKVDRFREYFIIYDCRNKSSDFADQKKNNITILSDSIKSIFNIDDSKIIIKSRQQQKGKDQYNRLDRTRTYYEVQEFGAKFFINLYDYLDTGFFLDHRPLRKILSNISQDKNILNLFSYTSTLSISAALGGSSSTVSVDMSKTYTNWSIENFENNNLSLEQNVLINKNVFDYLNDKKEKGLFDIIILDPPSFSNSKKMDRTLDIQRDHIDLINLCANRLSEEGVIYFSNNLRSFKLDSSLLDNYKIEDISDKTIPEDFRDKKIHSCFLISKKIA